ncbi:hypothetical protein [Actinoplanes sp. NPDC049802]|uniref:hypothetical protein n=1 Tax=Actinoplanes sp. NPDC049802 TaxID=3154742 RepID=UPI00340B0A27
MSVLTRPAVLLASAAVAAGLLVAPGAAYAADTTTQLTAAEMKAALEKVSAASDTAAAEGWKGAAGYRFTESGKSVTGTETITADRTHGLLSDVFAVDGFGATTLVLDEGDGVYQSISGGPQVDALKMMGRSAVKYVFVADKTVSLEDSAPDPGDLVEDYAVAGTRTAHEDGSAHYAFTAGDGVSITLHVGADAVLTGTDATMTEDGGTSEVSLDYSYGPQTVHKPAAAETIDHKTLATGVAYLTMPETVKRAASLGAADTRKAAKGRKVNVTTLRRVVRADASAVNSYAGVAMVKVKNVSGGVRVFGTNPWTKKTVTYSVKASGKKVVVKKL